MAPKKKTEEKATANEAADMVLHYLRKSCTSTLSEGVIRVGMTCDGDFANAFQASKIDRIQQSMSLQIYTTRSPRVRPVTIMLQHSEN
jgi:hypothetical protein